MEYRRILKVLPNGYEIPYPEELQHDGMVFLKDCGLNAYPKAGAGEFDCSLSEEDYESWLEGYL